MTEDKKNGMPNPEEINSDITAEERALLDESLENSSSVDNNNLWRSALDNTDDSGELLNEESSADDFTGEDLDIPGAELDDANEEIGEEDEENNGYSQADTE
jgi:hypothetical protein